MMTVTKKQLESAIARLNDALGLPQEPYAEKRDANGSPVANAGVYYLAGAYGGTRVEQMCKGGGSRDVTRLGTKRETYIAVNHILDGIEAVRKAGI